MSHLTRRRVAVLLAVMLGGWLLFDGARALLLGNYVTQATGPYAGQLGPWATLLNSIGIPPRSRAAIFLHLVTGLLWMIVAAAPAHRRLRSAVVATVVGLWYLPFGPVIGLACCALLAGARPARQDSSST